MQDRILKIEKVLKKREHHHNAPNIVVREIIGYPVTYDGYAHAPIYGEYKAESFDEAYIPQTTIPLPIESEEECRQRIGALIDVFAEEGKKIHHQNNFRLNENNQYEMLSNKGNHITRVLCPEFTFYPALEQGPLSANGFHQLMRELEVKARQYPANLHLVLASIPVIVSPGKIQNIALYIQCGERVLPSQIQIFAKAIPSNIDPVYPNYENVIASSRMPEASATKKMLEARNTLYKCFVNNGNFTKALNDFKTVVINYPFKPHTELMEAITDFENELTTQPEKPVAFPGMLFYEFDKLIHAATSYDEEKGENLPDGVFCSSEEGDVFIQFSRMLEIATADGTKATLAANICLDIAYNIAASHVIKKINTPEGYIGTHATDLLLSNSIYNHPQNTISDTNVQADPSYSANDQSYVINHRRQKPVSSIEISTPPFGSNLKIDIYSEAYMPTFKEPLLKDVLQHNDFQATIDAFRIETAHHLQEMPDPTVIKELLTKLELEQEKQNTGISSFFNKFFTSPPPLPYVDIYKQALGKSEPFYQEPISHAKTSSATLPLPSYTFSSTLSLLSYMASYFAPVDYLTALINRFKPSEQPQPLTLTVLTDIKRYVEQYEDFVSRYKHLTHKRAYRHGFFLDKYKKIRDAIIDLQQALQTILISLEYSDGQLQRIESKIDNINDLKANLIDKDLEKELRYWENKVRKSA